MTAAGSLWLYIFILLICNELLQSYAEFIVMCIELLLRQSAVEFAAVSLSV